jgi:hypothetical protein
MYSTQKYKEQQSEKKPKQHEGNEKLQTAVSCVVWQQ